MILIIFTTPLYNLLRQVFQIERGIDYFTNFTFYRY